MRSTIEILRRGQAIGAVAVSLLVAACGGGGGAAPDLSTPAQNPSDLGIVQPGSATPIGAPAGCRAVTNSGRVAHWSFDNVAGAKAFNTRFDAFHATLNSVSVVPGVVGAALQFDRSLARSYAHLDLFDRRGVNVMPTFYDNRIGVALWIRPEQLQAGATYQLFGGSSFGPQSFHVRLVDGKVRFLLNALHTGGSGEDLIIESSASVVAGQWQHVAVTYDGSTARVYLNGTQDAQRSISHPISTAYNTLYLGGTPSGAGTFPGAIDELLLSNDLLSAADIAGLANAAAVTPITSACGSALPAPLMGTSGPAGQEAQWSFDNVSAAHAPNTRFNALHATLNSVTVTPGAVGQGLLFDASVNQSYAEISVISGGATAGPVFPDARISVGMWINPTQIHPAATYVLLGGGPSGGQSFHLRIVDGKLAFSLNSLDSGASGEDLMLRSAASMVAGQWQHVAVTSDGLAVRIYVNGVLDAEKTISHPVASVINTLYIGGLPRFYGGRTFPGTIDEVKLTNTALTASQVATLATR